MFGRAREKIMCEFNILAMMGEPGHARGDPNLSWESSRWLLIHLPHHSRQFSPGPEPGQLRRRFFGAEVRCEMLRFAGVQEQLPPGLVRAERQPADSPEVVEIWFV